MFAHPKPQSSNVAVHAGTVYYSAESRQTVALKPLTALEQMFGYWGADLAK